VPRWGGPVDPRLLHAGPVPRAMVGKRRRSCRELVFPAPPLF
jgi:hypothetical protein